MFQTGRMVPHDTARKAYLGHEQDRASAGKLAGQPVDRPPLTMWYHFGNQHAPAERTALFEHYDLDLLKLMNDYGGGKR